MHDGREPFGDLKTRPSEFRPGETMATRRNRTSVPPTTIRRLSIYFRVLSTLENIGETSTSSGALAAQTGFTAAQVRRDLTYFGSFGKRGVGYEVTPLRQHLATILGVDRDWRMALIGVGNLGRALLSYGGFENHGFNIVAAFDIRPELVGKLINGLPLHHISDMNTLVSNEQIEMFIVAVPAVNAQIVVDQAVDAGARAILNFSPAQIRVPGHIKLSNVDLTMEVEYLSYAIRQQKSNGPA